MIDDIDGVEALQTPEHIPSGIAPHLHHCISGVKRNMRRDQAVREREQLGRAERLILQYIQRDATQATSSKSFYQSSFLYQRTASGIHQEGARYHGTQLRMSD